MSFHSTTSSVVPSFVSPSHEPSHEPSQDQPERMREQERTESRASASKGVRVTGVSGMSTQDVLTPEAVEFLRALHVNFNSQRIRLLERRKRIADRLEWGERPDLLSETEPIRNADWKVAAAPADLDDRRVEITGPAEPKMMINALNSGASVFMADLEDALSPTWANVMEGQRALAAAVRRKLELTSPEGKSYRLNDRLATLVVRPRGWHLVESHLWVDGENGVSEPMSASLVDFGLYFFHNANELLARGTGPYFYLPKLESHLEARLWNDVFNFAQDYLGIRRGTIRATVLIETILAAFEMDEILYELRDHAAGLNAGRWDYIFSAIKKFSFDRNLIYPDRAQLTMTVPFMRAYTQRLVNVCHRRGAHAIGGMAAFIPSRRDPEVNAIAIQKVREDKDREARDGFDGTWVAHPDLVPIAREIFDDALGSNPHQKNRNAGPVTGTVSALLPRRASGGTVVSEGEITDTGLRNNINVTLQYLDAWLQGFGAVAIHNLMEDAATAEISRAELWQWVHHQARLASGETINASLFVTRLEDELAKLGGPTKGRLKDAATLLERLVVSAHFPEFLTVPAYELLDKNTSQ